MSRSKAWKRIGTLALCMLAGPAAAQDADEPGDDGSRYAHVRHVQGQAVLVRAYDAGRVPLDVNLPIVAGDRLEAEAGSRVEIGLADGSFVRVQGPLALDVHALAGLDAEGEDLTHLTLGAGDLSLEIAGRKGGSEPTCRVDLPSGTVYAMTGGLYRLSVNGGGDALVSVRSGVAEVEGGEGSVLLRSGQATRLRAGEPPADPGSRLARRDDFDAWVEERRGESEGAVAEGQAEDLPEPVQPYAGELSRYGRWETHSSFGTVWVPAGTGAGWYPYYSGYWLGSPSGYFWISYEPWGWIPYHYGRWEWIAGLGWAWIPGPAFAGAWVHWWAGPSYVAWVPLGYYGRPAIDIQLFFSSGYRRPRAGFACVPYPVFFSRDLPRRYIREERVLRQHMSQAVPVRRLPRFHPRDVRVKPGLGMEVYTRARRAAAAPPPRRAFHPAPVSTRPVAVRQSPGPFPGSAPGARRPVRPASGTRAARPQAPTREPSPVNATTILRRLDSNPLPSPPPQAERGSARQGPSTGVRELLDRLSRSGPVPTPRRQPEARPRPPRGDSSRPSPRPSSSPRSSRPHGQGKPH
jgi:hypothetical protein